MLPCTMCFLLVPAYKVIVFVQLWHMPWKHRNMICQVGCKDCSCNDQNRRKKCQRGFKTVGISELETLTNIHFVVLLSFNIFTEHLGLFGHGSLIGLNHQWSWSLCLCLLPSLAIKRVLVLYIFNIKCYLHEHKTPEHICYCKIEIVNIKKLKTMAIEHKSSFKWVTSTVSLNSCCASLILQV